MLQNICYWKGSTASNRTMNDGMFSLLQVMKLFIITIVIISLIFQPWLPCQTFIIENPGLLNQALNVGKMLKSQGQSFITMWLCWLRLGLWTSRSLLIRLEKFPQVSEDLLLSHMLDWGSFVSILHLSQDYSERAHLWFWTLHTVGPFSGTKREHTTQFLLLVYMFCEYVFE